MQVSEMDAFHCHEPVVSSTYKYKLLRAAFSNLPTLKDTNNQIRTKVAALSGSAAA